MKLRSLVLLLTILISSCSEEEIPCACPLIAHPIGIAGMPASIVPPQDNQWETSYFLKATENPVLKSQIPIGNSSYDLLKQFLNRNELPPQWLISPSEMVNAFKYNKTNLSNSNAIRVHTEVHTSPWDESLRLVRVVFESKKPLQEPLNYSLRLNTFSVYKYRLSDLASYQSSIVDSSLGVQKVELEKPNVFQSTVFLEVSLRPEIQPPISDLHLFDIEISEKHQENYLSKEVIDQGEGLLTASRDFYFSSGVAWWALMLTDRLPYHSGLLTHLTLGLNPVDFPEREDLFPFLKIYEDIYWSTGGWCGTVDYVYEADCDCP